MKKKKKRDHHTKTQQRKQIKGNKIKEPKTLRK